MSTRAPETEEIRTAKLFMNGRSQAVRLPKEFRFEGSEVAVRKVGDSVIIEPLLKSNWPEGFFERLERHAELFREMEFLPQEEDPPIKNWVQPS